MDKLETYYLFWRNQKMKKRIKKKIMNKYHCPGGMIIWCHPDNLWRIKKHKTLHPYYGKCTEVDGKLVPELTIYKHTSHTCDIWVVASTALSPKTIWYDNFDEFCENMSGYKFIKFGGVKMSKCQLQPLFKLVGRECE